MGNRLKVVKVPAFDSLKGQFELEPLITVGGKGVFYDKCIFKSDEFKQIKGIPALKCLSINDRK